jgi:hypothetical protein
MIEKVVELSSKLITFIDMGGHKRVKKNIYFLRLIIK